jgi:hypothetical protein
MTTLTTIRDGLELYEAERERMDGVLDQASPSLNSDGEVDISSRAFVEYLFAVIIAHHIIPGLQNEPECSLAKIFKALPLASSAGKAQKRLVSCGREARAERSCQ